MKLDLKSLLIGGLLAVLLMLISGSDTSKEKYLITSNRDGGLGEVFLFNTEKQSITRLIYYQNFEDFDAPECLNISVIEDISKPEPKELYQAKLHDFRDLMR